jgi:hypothetical protein
MPAAEALHRKAGELQQDIIADGHVQAIEGYDVWIEQLRDLAGVQRTVGVIDIGDLYQGVYEWDGREWEQSFGWGEPQAVIDRIIRARQH